MVSPTTFGFVELVLSAALLGTAWLIRPATVFKARRRPWPVARKVLYWTLELGAIFFGLGFLVDLSIAHRQYGGYVLFLFVLGLTIFVTATLPAAWRPPGRATDETLRLIHQLRYSRTSLPVVGMAWTLLACWAAVWSYARLGSGRPLLAHILLSIAVIALVLVAANIVGILCIHWFSRPQWLMPPATRLGNRSRTRS